MKTTALWFALAMSLPCQLMADDQTQENREKAIASAQQRLQAAAEELTRLGAQNGDRNVYRYAFRTGARGNQPRIGVLLATEDGRATISAVTPGGPAESAGVLNGDRLLSVDGKTLDSGADAAESARKALSGLTDGQEVQLGIERAGKKQTLTVKARTLAPQIMAFSSDGLRRLEQLSELKDLDALGPEFERNIEMIVRNAHTLADQSGRMGNVHIRRHSDLELASISPELGKYFGTDKGVLVLSENDRYPGLETGDALLEIAGKPVTSARDAWRAMNSFEEGEKFEVVLLREKSRRSVMVTAPRQDIMTWMLPPPPPPPPEAPEAPIAPGAKGGPGVPPPPAPPAPPAAPTAGAKVMTLWS